jgi:hypothetical protein
MKKCSKCNGIFSESLFYADASKADGRRGCCKSCDSASCRDYQRRNKKQTRAYRRKWYATHRKETSAHNRRSRERNMGCVLISAARSRARHKRLPFDLDHHRDEIIARVALARCELTGIALNMTGKRAFDSASLDRITPEDGYLYRNIRVVAYSVNCALGTWGEHKLRDIAAALLRR